MKREEKIWFETLVTAILLVSSAALVLGAGPLKIGSTQADLDAVPQTLTIEGQRFGSQGPELNPPDVFLEGDRLVVEIYNFDTQIVALLPPGILPGDYELTVVDGADPARGDTVTITIAASGPQKLEISGAEPDVGTGTILISGANLGDAATLPADFDVRLFVPDPAMVGFGTNVLLPVTAFDPATQEIGALLPAGLFPGTFRLTVSKVAGNETDTLDVTLGDLDLDLTNELNTAVALNGTILEVTDDGGTLSADLISLVNDADASPLNELNTLVVLNGTILEVSDLGGTLGADLSSLVDDADADPLNEVNTSVVLNGTILEVTDAGGTLSADLSNAIGGNTLDAAYDQGGGGAGRTITADTGAVRIDGPGGLELATGNLLQSPGNPVLVGSLAIGGFPRSVYVSGRYAYVADQTSADLKVIDVSDPSAPSLVGSLGTGGRPISVYVSGRYAYVAEPGSSSLLVIDVSDPSAPNLVGSLGLGGRPHSVHVSGRYAYVVDFDNDEMKVIDVSDPSAPSLAGSLVIGGDPPSVYVSGRYAYVVDGGSDDLTVIDVSDQSAPSLAGSLGIGGVPFSVYVSGRYAYVVDTGSDDLKVIDISGAEVTSLVAHSLEAGNLQVRNDMIAQGQLQVTGGLNLGAGGMFSDGDVGVGGDVTITGDLTISGTCTGCVSDIDDADADPNNELNSSVSLNGTTLRVTDAGGTLGADLSSLVDDADADAANEFNSSVFLNGTILEVSDLGGTLGADLSGLVAGAGFGDGHSLDAADGDPADVLFVNHDGNVGIGTTGPVAADPLARTLQLGNEMALQDVIGNQVLVGQNVHYDGLWKRITGDVASAVRLHHGGVSFYGIPGGPAGSTIPSMDSSDVKMAILNSGNVGIGTTNPTALLDVNGDVGVGGDVTITGDLTVSGSCTGCASDIPIVPRNPLQVALLRWYGVNQAGNHFAGGGLPIDLAFDGAHIWVTSSGDNTVTKLRASDGMPLGTFPVGTFPIWVAFDGANIWVANQSSNTVTKLRASDGVEEAGSPFAVGNGATGLAFDGTHIWVTNVRADTVSKLRPSDGVTVGTFATGDSPTGLAFDGVHIWVTNGSADTVSKLRASDGMTVATFATGDSPHGLAFDGANIWVAGRFSGTVSKH